MRPDIRRIAIGAAALAAAVPATAGAAVPHVVQQGETLWTIASANNLTNRALAAYNGLAPEGHVVLGSTVMVPTPPEAYAAMQKAGMVAAAPAQSAPAQSASAQSAAAASASAPSASAPSGAPTAMGGYTVRLGDTLGALARNAGVSVAQIAQMNGLDPAGTLLAGTVIKLPTGSPQPPRSSQPAPAATVVPAAAPAPTPGRVSAAEVQQIAATHGVPASLAAAIGWQESGFNNAMVSAANARGVMQIMPGTWSWIQGNLANQQLDPNSAADNVHAGVLYLGRLLRESGGDENTAIAGYYQGLGSVRSRGLFEDTKQYVANVQALRARFGG